MRPLDPDLESLLREWVEKAEADLEAADKLAPSVATSQQTIEKYLKVLLTFHQVEFPKTHEIERLLALAGSANPEAADALGCTKWLGPFAVDIRYPGDAAEMVPGDEVRAIKIARFAKAVVLRVLDKG